MILKEFGSSPLQRGRTRTTGKVYIDVTTLNYLLCVSKGNVCIVVPPAECILNFNLILHFGSKQYTMVAMNYLQFGQQTLTAYRPSF